MTTPLERLLAEELPTGTFGHATPPQPRDEPSGPAWTPAWTEAEQAQHLADLTAALDGWQEPGPRADHKRARDRRRMRRLRLITDQPAA